ncbi:MAG: sigma-70 family RNA polymerase sigma factor [Planctomycetota bacterium]
MTAEPSDGDLIHATLEGDDDAFAVLVDRYKDKVYWIAYGLTGHVEDSRDVCQDAFVRVYRALGRFDFRMSFYTWLYRIVVNLAIDQLRRATRARMVDLDEIADGCGDLSSSPADGLEREELRRGVHEVLEKLPDKYRQVMVLRDLSGLSCKQIAAIVGVSHATARWRLHMARKMFREHWERRHATRRRAEGDALP